MASISSSLSQTVPGETRITVDPVESKTKITVEKVRTRLALTLAGGGFSFRVDKKDNAAHQEVMATIDGIYEEITQIVKPGEKIFIHIDKGAFSYGPKDNRTMVYFDSLNNSDLDEKLALLRAKFNEIHPRKSAHELPKYTLGLRGNNSGIASFDRSGLARIEKQPKDFTQFSNKFLPELFKSNADLPDRLRKMKHMAVAETAAIELLNEMKTIRNDLKTAHETAHKADPNSQATKDAQKALDEQNTLVQTYASLDIFAVFSALAFVPKDDNNAIERGNCVESAYKSVVAAIHKEREPIQLKIWKWGTHIELTESVKHYVQDIAGLLIDDRGEYKDHCFKAEMHQKRNSLEHLFLMRITKGIMSGKPDNDIIKNVKDCFDDDFKGKYGAKLEACIQRILTSAKAIKDKAVNLSANQMQNIAEFQVQCYSTSKKPA